MSNCPFWTDKSNNVEIECVANNVTASLVWYRFNLNYNVNTLWPSGTDTLCDFNYLGSTYATYKIEGDTVSYTQKYTNVIGQPIPLPDESHVVDLLTPNASKPVYADIDSNYTYGTISMANFVLANDTHSATAVKSVSSVSNIGRDTIAIAYTYRDSISRYWVMLFTTTDGINFTYKTELGTGGFEWFTPKVIANLSASNNNFIAFEQYYPEEATKIYIGDATGTTWTPVTKPTHDGTRTMLQAFPVLYYQDKVIWYYRDSSWNYYMAIANNNGATIQYIMGLPCYSGWSDCGLIDHEDIHYPSLYVDTDGTLYCIADHSSYLNPVLFKSFDFGQTWSVAIPIELEGVETEHSIYNVKGVYTRDNSRYRFLANSYIRYDISTPREQRSVYYNIKV